MAPNDYAELSRKIADLERTDPLISRLSTNIRIAAEAGDMDAENFACGVFNAAIDRRLGTNICWPDEKITRALDDELGISHDLT